MTDPTFLAALYLEKHPREAADLMGSFDLDSIAELITALPDETVPDLLTSLLPAKAGAVVAKMSDADGARFLGMMKRREAASILRNMPRERRDALLETMSVPTRVQLDLVLHQPPHRVGAWVESVPFALARDTTVENARRRLRGAESAITELYILDEARHLVGVIPLFRLFSVAGGELVESIALPPAATLRANSGIETALENPAWTETDSLPVLDHDGVLVGTVRHAMLREALSRKGVVELDDRGEDYMGVANNLYGLAEVLVTSIGRNTTPKPSTTAKGGSS